MDWMLDNITAADLERARGVILRHLSTMGGLAGAYPDASDEIRRDEDALGLVLVAVTHAARRRAFEERERAHLWAADQPADEEHDHSRAKEDARNARGGA